MKRIILLVIFIVIVLAACERDRDVIKIPEISSPPTTNEEKVEGNENERKEEQADPVLQQKGDADVEFVSAIKREGSWTFSVTVRHPDTGWEDYADGWDVVTHDGIVLKPDESAQFTRLLLHPHVSEQPFTRSQSGIEVPPGVTLLTVRAHDIVDGFGGREVEVDLEVAEGERFKVER